MPDNRNTDEARESEPSVIVTGNPDVWQLLCKASADGWMKSTKVLDGKYGCVVQVTTEHRDSDGRVTCCAESVTHCPGESFETLSDT